MGLAAGLNYVIMDFLFKYHCNRYVDLRSHSFERATKHLKKAVKYGKEFIDTAGFVSGREKEVLGLLEKEANKYCPAKA